ncbi:EamA family transporter RarD [Candidatus Uabimicrobium sp. HlEnr_7]|uniref:EamA family transporter RarD n=1 Tax=Candidatus Uabimicrobium helgolandensis TaxID=3095367 RepID=UPI0035589B24
MGYIFVICAYLLWGVFPLFWKQLSHIPVIEIIFHRMFWSCITMIFFLTALRNWQWVSLLRKSPKTILLGLLSSILITSNWIIFVWSVNNGYLVEASLGYFINPLLYIVVGVCVFKEKVRRGQIAAVAIAAIGVFYLTFVYGHFPFIAFTLAGTFTLYGLIRKVVPLGAFAGLFLETAFMILPAIFYILYIEVQKDGNFYYSGFSTQILFISTGVVTVAPLLFFAAGIRRIELYAVGFLQYIAPTLQFLLGVFLYKEAFSFSQLIGFSFIWLAILVFCIESYIFFKQSKMTKVLEET